MNYTTQNDLLLNKLMQFYNKNDNLENMLKIINGESKISLRIVDWFVTNYSKKNFVVYDINKNNSIERFKVYTDYKLKLKAYSKKRFDPFCRWDRITIPYKDNKYIQTTIGQLNFFKWAIENDVIKELEKNYKIIDTDMNSRNNLNKSKNYSINSNSSTSSTNSTNSCTDTSIDSDNDTSNLSINNKTRKKREELSQNASRSLKKENVPTIITF